MQSKPAPEADVRRNDELAIRQLVENWLAASKSGDVARFNSLMAEDVLFLTPGREPFDGNWVIARDANFVMPENQ